MAGFPVTINTSEGVKTVLDPSVPPALSLSRAGLESLPSLEDADPAVETRPQARVSNEWGAGHPGETDPRTGAAVHTPAPSKFTSAESFWGFPDSSAGKESACHAGDPSSIPGSGRSAGEGIGCPLQYSWASILAQSVKIIGLQCRRPRFDSWVQKICWRRKQQPTPVFLPGESHGQRGLAGYSPRVTKGRTCLSD